CRARIGFSVTCRPIETSACHLKWKETSSDTVPNCTDCGFHRALHLSPRVPNVLYEEGGKNTVGAFRTLNCCTRRRVLFARSNREERRGNRRSFRCEGGCKTE